MTMNSPIPDSHPHRFPRLLASTLAGVLALAPSCSKAPIDDPRLLAQSVAVYKVKLAQERQRTFTGVVEARVVSNLGFRVGGKVLERSVNVGQHVKRGQRLMRLDAVDLNLAVAAQKANVEASRARYTQAKADEARAAGLVKTGAISRQEYDLMRASLDSSKALLDAAEAQAKVTDNSSEYAELLADADGVIVRTAAEPGQVVAAGQMVIQLAQDGPREALIHLPEGLRPKLESTATARFHGNDASSYGAKLRELSDSADATSRTFEARYVLEGEAAATPLGSTVSVTIATNDSPNKEAVSVPVAAVHNAGTGSGVWVVDGNATVRFRPVQIARVGKEEAVLTSGVQVGETVVALGAHLLHEAQSIRVANQQEVANARF